MPSKTTYSERYKNDPEFREKERKRLHKYYEIKVQKMKEDEIFARQERAKQYVRIKISQRLQTKESIKTQQQRMLEGHKNKIEKEKQLANECRQMVIKTIENDSKFKELGTRCSVFDERVFKVAPAIKKLAKAESDASMQKRKWQKVLVWAITDVFLSLRLKPSEMSGLKTSDVHLDCDHPYITVKKHISSNHFKDTDLPLPEDLIDHLKEYLSYRSELIHRQEEGYSDSNRVTHLDGEWLLPGKHGQLTSSVIVRQIRVLCHRIGILNHNRRIDTNKPEAYVIVYVPDHPMAKSNGQILEHRLVMYNHIGRVLFPFETVHHKNNIVRDNRLENLELRVTFGKQLERYLHENPEFTRYIDSLDENQKHHPAGLSMEEIKHALLACGRIYFPHLLIPELRAVELTQKNDTDKKKKLEQLTLFA